MTRLVVVVLVLLAAVLSGCSSPEPEGAEAAAPTDVITDPLDYSYLQNATPGSHIHDYWQGRDRVPVLDEQGGSFSASCSGGCDDGMGFSRRQPGDGVIVPQGTKWVNGTITLTKDGENTWTRLELWVRTAEDAEAALWGDVQSGVPFSINSTLEQNDPPHYVLSLWEFSLRAYSGGEDVRVAGSLDWSVEAVRGLPLVPFPPHPDRWNGATELDLLQDAGASSLTYETHSPSGGTSTSCYDGCPGTHRLGDGVVVPFETGTIEVRLTYGPGLPAGLGLSFHGSDTRAFTKVSGTSESPTVTLFAVPLEVGMADSPYAKQSLWEFDVWMDEGQGPDLPVQAWSGTYTIDVKAIHA